ncbi:MAG: GDYXXLXY domain-containing protein [Syntrophomonadaceae bacterium]|jgi:hypothetical protein|nr:GDYXXLXY domain-containing protein [Syntrophomonadaceae bacterium]
MRRERLLQMAILLPLLVLLALPLPYLRVLRYGSEVRLAVRGYDPAELFRGNYVQVTYAIEEELNRDLRWEEGRPRDWYVVLRPQGGIHVLERVTETRPAAGALYLVAHSNRWGYKELRVPDRLFLPRERALRLQEAINRPGAQLTARLTVLEGQAVLRDISGQ